MSERRGDGTVCTVCQTPLLVVELIIIVRSMIPETKGRSLEEMDIVFGAVSADNRAENIARHEHGACFFFSRDLFLPENDRYLECKSPR